MHFFQFSYLLHHDGLTITVIIFFFFCVLCYLVTAILNAVAQLQDFPHSPADVVMLILQKHHNFTQVGYQETKPGMLKQKTESYYRPTASLISFGEEEYHQQSVYTAAEAIRLGDSALNVKKYPAPILKILNYLTLFGASLFTLCLLIDGILKSNSLNSGLLIVTKIGYILYLLGIIGSLILAVLLPLSIQKTQAEYTTEYQTPSFQKTELTIAQWSYGFTQTGGLAIYSLGILYDLWLLLKYLIKTKRI